MVASVVLAGLAALALLVVPFGTSTSTTSARPDGAGPTIGATTTTSTRLLESEGASVVPLLLVPVLVTATPLVWRRRVAARAAAILLTVFTVLGAASVGLFYLPATIVMWLSLRRRSGTS